MRSKGKCKKCGKELTKSGMIRHLKVCNEQEFSVGDIGYFVISIQGTYNKEYWLIIEIKEDATLKDLDQFLRDIWLECCGHLSAFEIDKDRFLEDIEDFMGFQSYKSISEKLVNVLYDNLEFEYEYDFGTTTDLTLKVINYKKGEDRLNKINILARNNFKEVLCDKCKQKLAQYICYDWSSDEVSNICDQCSLDGEYDEEVMLLPIVNSPRCGVCAYEGSVKYGEI